jgi:hypothetical protein
MDTEEVAVCLTRLGDLVVQARMMTTMHSERRVTSFLLVSAPVVKEEAAKIGNASPGPCRISCSWRIVLQCAA